MFDELCNVMMSFCGGMTGGAGSGSSLNLMNAAFDASLNAQMQATTNSIVQQNMNNPQVRQMYQQYLQQGGSLSFPQYCLRYTETGGFTPEGTMRAMQSQQAIQARDQANMQAYRQHSETLQSQTTAYRQAVDDKIARGRGENLSAQGQYVNPADGSTWQLSTNAAAGDYHCDPATGNHFCLDVHGQYWTSNGQGWWYPMNRC